MQRVVRFSEGDLDVLCKCAASAASSECNAAPQSENLADTKVIEPRGDADAAPVHGEHFTAPQPEPVTEPFYTSIRKADVKDSIAQGPALTGFVSALGEDHFRTCGELSVEGPTRISAILRKMDSDGLLDRCVRVSGRMASIEELGRIHADEFVQAMDLVQELDSQADIDEYVQAMDYTDVFLTRGSFRSACMAAGSVLALLEQVAAGTLRNGLAAVRPPGHHAGSDQCCGFCIFNTVAVAAAAAKDLGMKKVLIVDWDVHHGNGTQRVFEEDPSVLYFSVHRYENAEFFPYSKSAAHDKVGRNAGKGFNVNVAWNCSFKGQSVGMCDDDYLAVWHYVLLPIVADFIPDVVLISAGFDAAKGDPAGQCSVTPAGFAQMTRMLQQACPKIILVLEGGYQPSIVAECFTSCARALLGEDIFMRTEVQPKKEACLSIEKTLQAHLSYWPSLHNLSATTRVTLNVTNSGTHEFSDAPSRKLALHKGKQAKPKPLTRVKISTRNTAERCFKREIEKLQKKQDALENDLAKIVVLRQSLQGGTKCSSNNMRLVSSEDELRLQLDEVVAELRDLCSLSKDECLRRHIGA